MLRDNEYAPLYERYALNPKPDADSDKPNERGNHSVINIQQGKDSTERSTETNTGW